MADRGHETHQLCGQPNVREDPMSDRISASPSARDMTGTYPSSRRALSMLSVISSADDAKICIVTGGTIFPRDMAPTKSPILAIALTTDRGTVLSGAQMSFVSSICVTKDRNSTGAPSVTKYASPPRPWSKANSAAWQRLAICVVETSYRPPPIQANFPRRTIADNIGMAVVSSRPQTMRGRSETTLKVSLWKPSAIRSDAALLSE